MTDSTAILPPTGATPDRKTRMSDVASARYADWSPRSLAAEANPVSAARSSSSSVFGPGGTRNLPARTSDRLNVRGLDATVDGASIPKSAATFHRVSRRHLQTEKNHPVRGGASAALDIDT